MRESDRATVSRIGRNMAAERARRGLTQESLAELSGVSLAHLARMERGEVEARVLMYVRVAKALDVSVSTLLESA